MPRSWVLPLLLTCLSGAEELTPGVHLGLPAEGKVPATYDLFLPQAYVSHPQERFPLVLLSTADGVSDLGAFQKWAEANDVVLATVNHPSASVPATLRPFVEEVLTTVTTTYRVQPALRFSFATHPFVNDIVLKLNLAEWGGIVDGGSARAIKPTRAYFCLGYIPGPPTVANEFGATLDQEVVRLRSWGNPLRIAEVPEADGWRQHDDARALLDWMVLWQRLAHPLLTPAEVKAGQERLRLRIAALQAEPDAQVRMVGSAALLLVTPAAKVAEARALPALWAAAAFSVAQAESDPLQHARKLDALAANELVKTLSAAERKKLQETLVELKKNPDVRSDSESRVALAGAYKVLTDLRLLRIPGDYDKALRSTIMALEVVPKRWPGTAAAATAKVEITRLERELN